MWFLKVFCISLLDADVAVKKLAALALHIGLDQRQVTGGEE